jgi:DNA-binding NarL/FixJ family response regulator
MDMRLEGEGDGVDAALAIQDLVGSKVVFVTASTDPITLKRINSAAPVCVLTKPVSAKKLRAAVDAAFSGEITGPALQRRIDLATG